MVAKVRPCLVIIVVTHTTSTRGSRFEVSVRTRFLDTAGAFDARSIVTVPEVKFLKKLGTLPPEQLSAIEDAVRQWLKL